jgi:NADH-quinone oxidoreductase subunit M
MGFVLLGIYAMNDLALRGSVMQLVAHGLSTAALFTIVGMIQERWHTRDLRRLGGLWASLPRLSGFTMLFALASLGLPGLANFVAEFLILAGAFQAHWPLTVIAALGLVGAALYALLMVQRSLWGEFRPAMAKPDCSWRELVILTSLAVAIIYFGVRPQPVLERATVPTVPSSADIAPPVAAANDDGGAP